MAKLTIESDSGEKIVLIISPGDAFEILEKFQGKYPNATRTNLSLQEFVRRWTK